MSRLPLYVVIFLSTAIVVWNFTFYGVVGADSLHHTVDEGELAVNSTLAEAERTRAPAEMMAMLDTPGRSAASADRKRADAASEGDAAGEVGAAGSSEGLATGSAAGDPDENDQGLVFEELFYGSGAKRAAGHRRDGLRNGEWTEWWENGEVRSEGEYTADEPVGEWTYNYSSGSLRMRGRFEEGYRAGRWRGWHENGPLMLEGQYEGGTQQGRWTLWYSNGQVMESGHYLDGRRDGEWVFFDFSGRADRRTGTYILGRPQGQQ